MKVNTLNILIVDDNKQDCFFIEEVLRETQMVRSMQIAYNGEEALELLRKEDASDLHVTPDLIFLDINMPVKNGHETLIELKADAKLKHIPVIIFTTSNSAADVKKAYSQYANSYLVKPFEYGDMLNLLNVIREYWQKTVMLPTVV